jgi:glycosyltransferase involved in cell wall biosynthesis
MTPSVIILTFNSELTIDSTLTSARRVSDDIHVVDSFSTDRTLEIARHYGVDIVQHEFLNYGSQRNWAIQNLPLRYKWELHLDADEQLTDVLVQSINELTDEGVTNTNGFLLARLVKFLGQPIRFGGMYPIWHLRLFRRGSGRCEARQYDQHFLAKGRIEKLRGPMIDEIRMPLGEWVTRHNRWADAEVLQLLSGESNEEIKGNPFGHPIEQKRFLRKCYGGFPLFVRPFLLFLYRYVFRLGFLDGRAGLVFYVLQTFWFRFLIDAKIFEHRISRRL